MEILRLIVALLVGLAGTVAAQDAAAPRSVEIRFVPPGGEGTVSLGVFDNSGKLVRAICDEWTFNRFRIGINGLAVSWDGSDSSGQPVAAGTYDAGGFVVGDVKVEGEAVHFNDWIEGHDSPQIVTVAAAQLMSDGDVLLAARLAGATGALVRYSPESEARWRTVVSAPRPEPAKNAQLCVSDTAAFVLLDGVLRAANLADGSEIKLPSAFENTRAIGARGSRLAVLDDKALHFYALPLVAPKGSADNPPPGLVSVALLDNGCVAASGDGQLWLWQDKWSRIDLPGGLKVRQVSPGRGQTFWALEENSEGISSVAQYSPEEGNLARWTPAPGEGKISWMAASAGKDYFVAAIASPGVQRTVAIRRKEGGGWEYVFDKKITACANFGWSAGKLEPSSGELPAELPVQLDGNPLDPDAPGELTLRAFANETGTGLSAADGLPLVRVSDGPGFSRVMMVAGSEPNSVRFFQSNGACVEEYVISNLGAITPFDAGEIEMTATGEASPPPAEEPEEGAPAPPPAATP
ncbi:MAG: hypothetical protein FGM15_05650 [Chthoniobacterales bacterium]|nr:hypothetical protein [Chthoniobacterales bacterium]